MSEVSNPKKLLIHALKWIVGCMVVITAVITSCNLLIIDQTSGCCFDNLSDVPHRKVGLLLGTSPKLSDGRDNLYFNYRIQAAVELYNSGKIKYLLVSGDNGRNDYNEPLEMRKALIALGVPADRIVEDYAGFRTLDSVVRAQKVFGQSLFIVISQKFHNERAVYIARKYGIDAVGYNACDVGKAFGFKTRLREYLARVKVFVDLCTKKQPKYLGKEIHLP